MNLSDALILRSIATKAINEFFEKGFFIQVDTPLLLESVPVEAFVDVFSIPLKRNNGFETRYLPPSPEASLKKALAILGKNCWEMGHSFRDGEEEGPLHRAHFRMLEWYRINATYKDIMVDTIELFRIIDKALRSVYEDLPRFPVDIYGDWQIITCKEALAQYSDFNLDGPEAVFKLQDLVLKRDLGTPLSWQDAFCTILAIDVEPHLGHEKPTLLTEYPAGLAPQAKPIKKTPWLAEQFEVWIKGVELGNSYSEITDPDLQLKRFISEQNRLGKEGRAIPMLNQAYVEGLAKLPKNCAGGSLGFDRVMMMFLGASNIDQVRLS